MKRRKFLQSTLPAATLLPGILGGLDVKAYHSHPLMDMLGPDGYLDHDTVLVIIQFSGGNDGLNMVVPVEYMSQYTNARTYTGGTIALDEAQVLKLPGYQKFALHPNMTGMANLFAEGKLAVINAVGYPSPNFSHFRATDIWMTASDSNVVVDTGWAGRYLNTEFPNYPIGFPNTDVPDPLAIEISGSTTLSFQAPGVSTSLAVSDPNSFYALINDVDDPVPDTNWGFELTYLRQVARSTNQYGDRLKRAYSKALNQATYPASPYNGLGDRLKIIARLIKGGLKTRIYHVTVSGSFDTHSSQLTNQGALLKQVSDGIAAFMTDLKLLGLEDRVIGITYSEFGRRIKANSSNGTDHGAAAPMFVFGKHVKGGVIGNNPYIPTTVSVNDNVPFQYDFRSVYASLLNQWFCVNKQTLETVMLKNFQTLPLIEGSPCSTKIIIGNETAGISIISAYPNPFRERTTIEYTTQGGYTLVQVIDMMGRVVTTLTSGDHLPGTFQKPFDASHLPPGIYYIRLQNEDDQQVKPVVKVRD